MNNVTITLNVHKDLNSPELIFEFFTKKVSIFFGGGGGRGEGKGGGCFFVKVGGLIICRAE